jgi:hypothetical protein
MSFDPELPVSHGVPPVSTRDDDPITREEVLAHLNSMLEGPEFRASKRCQEFLRYVVEHALAHPSVPLKERTIGTEALGRPADYDTNADGVVRIRASEVRRRLLLHYANGGSKSTIHINLPPGNYIPVFSRAHPATVLATSETSLLPTQDHPEIDAISLFARVASSDNFIARHKIAGAAVVLLLIAGGVAAWLRRDSGMTSILRQFWQPVLSSSSPILVATDYAPVYLPPPNSETGAPTNTFTLLKDQYVGGGDLIAAVKISSLFTAAKHPYFLRMGTAVNFDDLRNTPTVLIGYSSTQWSEVTKNFRYYIDDGDLGMIRDNGKTTDWYPHNRSNDYHVTLDYAIVSRAFDPQTHAALILISGCTQYGTEGAARLVTDADLLTGALRGAPADWPRKNLQLILRIDLVANSPATAKVIASYYW